MFPYFNFGIFKIPSYALLLLLGLAAFVVCTITIVEKKEKFTEKETNQMLISSLFGFAFLALSAFLFNALFHSIEEGRIVFGGITWLGGVVGGFPFMIFMIYKTCPKRRGELLGCFDLVIPGVVIAHCFGRIGCFLGGCCYGGVTDSVLGVSFPAGSTASITYPAPDGRSLPVHPTQLYEAVFELVLFLICIIFYKKLKGAFLEIYLFGYGTFRFLIEFLRGDDRGSTGFVLTPSQFMSILLIIGAVLVILYKRGVIFKKVAKRLSDSAKEAAIDVIEALSELNEKYKNGEIEEKDFEKQKRKLKKLL